MSDAAGTPPFGPETALAVLAGATACALLPALPAVPLACALLLAGVLAWWRGRRRMRIGGAAVAALAWACLHGAHAIALQLPVDWEKRDVALAGRIVELPVREPRRVRFVFEADADGAAPLAGRRLRLAWYDGHDGPAPALRAGERWTLQARVRAPRGLRNPGAVDSERYAVARRIAAGGYVRAGETAKRVEAATGLLAWRERMSDRVAQALSADRARFLQALTVGDTRALSDEDWELLRATGLTHLVAISGFHVGLVAGLFALGARGVWWLWPALCRRVPRPVAAAVAGAGGALLYAAVAGFALPTVRTLLMIAVVAAARWSRRAIPAAQTLALATLAVLAVDPLSVLEAGFWLSFLGVAWLMWCLPPDAGRRPLRAFLSAQGVATLGLLPLTVALFGQASLAGPLANLIAVPWWSLVVVPLALLGLAAESLLPGAGAVFWGAAAGCFELTQPLFERLAASPLAVWWLPEPAWFALPLALLAAFWWLLPRGTPGKALATLLWLPLLWPDRELPEAGAFDIEAIDVGQGLAVLVRTRSHALLYDAGPAVQDGFDAGERAVVPVLHARAIRRLDRVVISHADNDHAGGWPAVARGWTPPVLDSPEGAGVEGASPCRAGDRWSWDGVRFTVLHPPEFFPYLRNESSCVLRIDGAHGSALLPGDIGEVVERDLVRRYGSALRGDVVVAPHHGSAGSSDPAFVRAVRARHVLVSTGHGNRFGHPKADVVRRWQAAGAVVHDTARAGALRVKVGARGIVVRAHRRERMRWWDAAHRFDAAGEPDGAR